MSLAEEGRVMAGRIPEYRIIVLSRRLKILGVLDTMSEQIPEVTDALAIIESQLEPRIAALGDGDWQIISHAHSISNGILIASFLARNMDT
jgi:hypothetical protein